MQDNNRSGSRSGGRSGGFSSNRGFGNRNNFRSNSFNGPREMHKTTCSKCKKECEVPFKPTQGKPVYCKECYQDIRNSNDSADDF